MMLSNKLWVEIIAVSCGVVSFFFLAIFYGKIFKIVYSNLLTKTRKLQSIKKLVTTTLILVGTFAITWLPFSLFEIGVLLYIHIQQNTIPIPVEK